MPEYNPLVPLVPAIRRFNEALTFSAGGSFEVSVEHAAVRVVLNSRDARAGRLFSWLFPTNGLRFNRDIPRSPL